MKIFYIIDDVFLIKTIIIIINIKLINYILYTLLLKEKLYYYKNKLGLIITIKDYEMLIKYKKIVGFANYKAQFLLRHEIF